MRSKLLFLELNKRVGFSVFILGILNENYDLSILVFVDGLYVTYDVVKTYIPVLVHKAAFMYLWMPGAHKVWCAPHGL